MIPFRKDTDARPVPRNVMQDIYGKLKTPNKRGAVIRWENDFTDSPTVFRYRDRFYMYFIAISKDVRVSGYETHLAVSDDLLHWEYVGPVFRRNSDNHWDSKQCAGYAAFCSIDYEGGSALEKWEGSYHMAYIGGNSDGYEPDPLYIGVASMSDPLSADSYYREELPILLPEDADARPQERKTLYKSCMFRDQTLTTGYPYVDAYNAKDMEGRERIFLAVSRDCLHWERYGEGPVLDLMTDDPDGHITGDPQILKIGDIYVMLFFHFRAGTGAFDTFACSYDLIHWTVWDGEPLIRPVYDWENVHAHKPWFVRWQGINYHFYCACNDKNERFIAVATS